MRKLVGIAVVLAVTACSRAPGPPAFSVARCVQPASVLATADATEARQRAAEARSLALAAQVKAREARRKGQETGSYVQDGYGMFVGKGGERYQGEIHGGKRNGFGTDVFPNGDRDEGHFSDNQFSGHGVYLHHNGDRYEGDFTLDVPNGWGVYYWPDGRRYEGGFACGHPNGPGVLTDASGSSHAGIWKDGALIDLFPPPAAFAAVAPASSPPRATQQSEAVQLKREHGTYMVPVVINGAITLPFVLDSGASDVAIPADVFLVLLRTHTVSQSDFIGRGVYILADGSKRASDRFMIHELTVGDHVIHDVIANVAPVKGDPLLGQSFLSKLPGWTIDNQNHVLILNDVAD